MINLTYIKNIDKEFHRLELQGIIKNPAIHTLDNILQSIEPIKISRNIPSLYIIDNPNKKG